MWVLHRPLLLQVGGRNEDVGGLALLIPELNAADLTAPGGALELLRLFAQASGGASTGGLGSGARHARAPRHVSSLHATPQALPCLAPPPLRLRPGPVQRAAQADAAAQLEREGQACLMVDELDERDAVWAEHLLQARAQLAPADIAGPQAAAWLRSASPLAG